MDLERNHTNVVCFVVDFGSGICKWEAQNRVSRGWFLFSKLSWSFGSIRNTLENPKKLQKNTHSYLQSKFDVFLPFPLHLMPLTLPFIG